MIFEEKKKVWREKEEYFLGWKDFYKTFMGFYFEWKKVLGSKKNPMIFMQRQVSKDFTCSKDSFFFFF